MQIDTSYATDIVTQKSQVVHSGNSFITNNTGILLIINILLFRDEWEPLNPRRDLLDNIFVIDLTVAYNVMIYTRWMLFQMNWNKE